MNYVCAVCQSVNAVCCVDEKGPVTTQTVIGISNRSRRAR